MHKQENFSIDFSTRRSRKKSENYSRLKDFNYMENNKGKLMRLHSSETAANLES